MVDYPGHRRFPILGFLKIFSVMLTFLALRTTVPIRAMAHQEVLAPREGLDCYDASDELRLHGLKYLVQDLVEDCILRTIEYGEHGAFKEQLPITPDRLAIMQCMAHSQNSHSPCMPPTP